MHQSTATLSVGFQPVTTVIGSRQSVFSNARGYFRWRRKEVEIVDWNLEETSVVILGAGFSSAATNGRMPLMSNFFDRLQKVQSPLLHDYVCSINCDVKTANVESVLLNLEQI